MTDGLRARWKEVWNEAPELTRFRVGATRLPEIVAFGDRLVLLKYASIGQWIDGVGVTPHAPQREGFEIVTAKVLDHVDTPADVASM
jgi:hypothetical protein